MVQIDLQFFLFVNFAKNPEFDLCILAKGKFFLEAVFYLFAKLATQQNMIFGNFIENC